jgi:hypothetical protein
MDECTFCPIAAAEVDADLAVTAQLTSAVLSLYGAEGSIVFQNNTDPDDRSSTCTVSPVML